MSKKSVALAELAGTVVGLVIVFGVPIFVVVTIIHFIIKFW